MYRPKYRAVACTVAAITVLTGASRARSAPGSNAQAPLPASPIFDPSQAPEIVLRIGVRRLVLTPHTGASETTLSARAIEGKTNSTSFSSIIASSVAGAAQSSSGELHIRGSHGQYTYYLDGAPLPASVSGSFSDLIDPKNIQTLRIYTGGFPAQYGNNLAAVFDVTAKAGATGRPRGFVQQIGQGYGTYSTTAQAGGGAGSLTYFLSGVRGSTDRRLDPVTPQPLHDAGNDSVVFGKFNYQAGLHDQIILDTAHTDGRFQIPNDNERQAAGQDDVQRENGNFANLILRHEAGANRLVTAIYSHQSRLRFSGSPADLLGATPDNPLVSTNEDRNANYIGLRTDYALQAGTRHKIGMGFDVSTLVGNEKFTLLSSDGVSPVSMLRDQHAISGGDRALYLQDDWTPGRMLINFGARYDIHKEQVTTSQVSPRLNMTYTAGASDKFHAYYNRLFQPAAIEDVRRLSGPTALGDAVPTPIKPERDNFYEVGWTHDAHGFTTSLSGYYKTERDVIDETVIGSTQIAAPFNVQKGYVRGLEVAVEGPLFNRETSFYANYARAWARSAGAISGGIQTAGAPPGYFNDDHDQTHTASVGVAYQRRGASVSVDGEYGSGFPYGQDDAGNVNIVRVPPHFILNVGIGVTLGRGQLTLTADNIVNHPYVIKQASPFTDRQFGQGRTLGVKWTQSF